VLGGGHRATDGKAQWVFIERAGYGVGLAVGERGKFNTLKGGGRRKLVSRNLVLLPDAAAITDGGKKKGVAGRGERGSRTTFLTRENRGFLMAFGMYGREEQPSRQLGWKGGFRRKQEPWKTTHVNRNAKQKEKEVKYG